MNLDLKCAVVAEKAAKLDLDEKLVSDASAILPRQGPYALTLYLDSKKQTGLLKHIGEILELADSTATQAIARDRVKHIAGKDSPAQLLLARRLLLQFFAYLKYLLKAKPKPAKAKATT